MTNEQYALYERLCREDWYEDLTDAQKFNFSETFWAYSCAKNIGLEELETEIREWLKEADYAQ